MKVKVFIILSLITIISCKKNTGEKVETTQASTLFTLVPESQTNIHFVNSVKQDFNFNYIDYPYAFTGAGVATGDINNDGLQDIYFTSNQNSNKLYLNKGNFKFEDITETAGVADALGWSTGVTMIDINNDGWLDIYVCKSASVNDPELRRNKLFINQKNNTFKEQSKAWGLDHFGFSIQSYFFDYDKDGDLDMYLVNHRPDFQNARKMNSKENPIVYEISSDHLYRNDGTKFTDVSLPAHIANHAWGLSASIGDFNNDGWLDIYVANDYIHPDNLYINNKNGTFTDQILQRMNHISYNSMGSDYADINNDMLPDLLTLDMSAEDHLRSKENMPTMNTKGFWMMVDSGYHHTYMSNVLQVNNGNGTYSDIGQLAGVSKTDWSWAPLIADFNNDGFKDIFVSNGIERELGNQDYIKQVKKEQAEKGAMTIAEMMNIMPSEKLSNYIYINNGDLTFKNTTEEWGLDKKLNSNGVAYADFDNDGDLDLVMNNTSDNATLYKNNSVNNYISIKLIGNEKNINAIGAKVSVITDKKEQYQELYTSRGYQSSVSNVLNFGIGDEDLINRIEVTWGDGTLLATDNVKPNQTITFNKKDFKFDGKVEKEIIKNFTSINSSDFGIDFIHQENDFNDFDIQVLLPQKQSTLGPALAVADVNADGLEDFYIGGAKDQAGKLYLQNSQGTFDEKQQPSFNLDKAHEDQRALFFDADGDNDLDLYITSGGYEFDEDSSLLQDRLYTNDGKGNYKKSNALPKMHTSTKGITVLDFDKDGDNDLIVGGRVISGRYPEAPRSYLLKNNNGKFEDITNDIIPELTEIGLVNDFFVTDYDNDGDEDFFVVGEWMPITLFNNNNGSFTKVDVEAFKNTEGWWNTMKGADFDNDGDQDYLIGNLGENNKFHPSVEKPLHIYGNYFDDNKTYDMVLSKVYKGKLVPVRGKECSTDQTPFISDKILTYKEFAASSLDQIYSEEKLQEAYHLTAKTFSSLYIQNNGDGTFTIKNLPSVAQKGPTMAFELADINKDGNIDVLGVGAIYNAEVETVRYDANTGYVLFGNGKGVFTPQNDISFYVSKNSKDMKKIKIANETHFIIANNNSSPNLLKLKG